MARVIAMLREARVAGLEVRHDGDALIVRGPEDLGGMARNLLVHKPLVLAALRHEDEYRGHELTSHHGEPADWRLGTGQRLVCLTCQSAIPGIDDDPRGVVRTVMAAADQATTEPPPAPRACPTCGSTGRCEGRLPTTNGGWVCRAAQAMGLFSGNGKHVWVRLRPGPGAGR